MTRLLRVACCWLLLLRGVLGTFVAYIAQSCVSQVLVCFLGGGWAHKVYRRGVLGRAQGDDAAVPSSSCHLGRFGLRRRLGIEGVPGATVPTSCWCGGHCRVFFASCARRSCPAWCGYAPAPSALEACHARTAHGADSLHVLILLHGCMVFLDSRARTTLSSQARPRKWAWLRGSQSGSVGVGHCMRTRMGSRSASSRALCVRERCLASSALGARQCFSHAGEPSAK